MKKFLALVLAGVMTIGVSVSAFAASSPTAAVVAAAAAQGQSVAEYQNNAIVTMPGLPDVLPIGQGGHVVINGAPSNQTFTLYKPSAKDVNLAKAEAALLGGKIVAFTGVKGSAKFTTAGVNFYIKGIQAGMNIVVYQQMADGTWAPVEATEIREDHVVCNMTSYGKLLFVQLP